MTITEARGATITRDGELIEDYREYDQDTTNLDRERLDTDLDTSIPGGTTDMRDSDLRTDVTEPDASETIRIVHNEGEDKPWELKFDDIPALKKARAILNYPVHKFETEQKAWEVADMLRNIIKADAVVDESGKAYKEQNENDFFQPIKT